jgi:hypothetical protein
MNAIEIVPITQDHIDGFHRALDIIGAGAAVSGVP